MKLVQQGAQVVIASLLCAYVAHAQSAQTPSVTKAFAVLAVSLDTNTTAKGDDVSLTTISDVVVNGRVVLPKGTSIIGHIGGVISKGKDEPKSVLAIVIDKAFTTAGEIPLQGIIVAIAAPKKSLPDDPTYGMMHSREPKMVGSGVASGTASPSSKSSSTAAVATAQLKGRADEALQLTEESQGAFGYEEEVFISWHLSIPPPLTVFATKSKRLRLEAGSQMLLRMAEPRLPN